MIRSHLPYFLLTVLFLVGVYCVVSKKHLVKIVLGIFLADIAVNVFLVLLGYNARAISVGGHEVSGLAPVAAPGIPAEAMVHPVPQALVVSAVVVGLATMVLAVAICIRLRERYGTYDITEIRRLRG